MSPLLRLQLPFIRAELITLTPCLLDPDFSSSSHFLSQYMLALYNLLLKENPMDHPSLLPHLLFITSNHHISSILLPKQHINPSTFLCLPPPSQSIYQHLSPGLLHSLITHLPASPLLLCELFFTL